MFERYTERSREVVVSAQELAREARLPEITPVCLYGALWQQDDTIAARVLKTLNARGLDETKEMLAIGVSERTALSSQIPFTQETKVVLENSLREALSLGHNYIGTEHILMALCRLMPPVFELDPEKVRQETIRMLRGVPKLLGAKKLIEQVMEIAAANEVDVRVGFGGQKHHPTVTFAFGSPDEEKLPQALVKALIELADARNAKVFVQELQIVASALPDNAIVFGE